MSTLSKHTVAKRAPDKTFMCRMCYVEIECGLARVCKLELAALVARMKKRNALFLYSSRESSKDIQYYKL
jgi:hypothetical protein